MRLPHNHTLVRIDNDGIHYQNAHGLTNHQNLTPDRTLGLIKYLVFDCMDSNERQAFLSLLPDLPAANNSTRETASIQPLTAEPQARAVTAETNTAVTADTANAVDINELTPLTADEQILTIALTYPSFLAVSQPWKSTLSSDEFVTMDVFRRGLSGLGLGGCWGVLSEKSKHVMCKLAKQFLTSINKLPNQKTAEAQPKATDAHIDPADLTPPSETAT